MANEQIQIPEQTSETAINIWQEVIDVWEHGFMGIDIGKILVALLILFAFMLLRGLFTKYVLNTLHRLTKKTETDIDDKIIDALTPPIQFVPIILGIYFSSQYAGVDNLLGDHFARIIRSLIVFTLFWGLFRAIAPASSMFKNLEKVLTPAMVQWLFKAVKVMVLFIGAAIILETWGIRVGPLLAGLGIFGAAIALGAQDMFKNMIGGLTIIAEKKFSPGDWIMVDGIVEGTVEDIGFRSTAVRRFDKAPVQVPNSLLSDAAITNFSRMSHRRIYWKIGVEYRTTVDQLKTIRDSILTYINENDDFDKTVTTLVFTDSFNDSSIDIMVYCFTKTTVWAEWLGIKEALAFKIKDIVENEAGTGFAFPSQSLYLESWPGDTPELFIPPAQKA